MRPSSQFRFALHSVVALSLGASVTAWAVPVSYAVSSGKTEFLAIGRPSALRIRGTGAAPKGTLSVDAKSVSGTLTLDLNSLDTGIELRNKHMKERYLETGKYPTAAAQLTSLVLPFVVTGSPQSFEKVPAQAKLTLHGITRPIPGTASGEASSGTLKMHFHFPLKISDFSIPIPTYLGITVADQVEVDVDVTETH